MTKTLIKSLLIGAAILPLAFTVSAGGHKEMMKDPKKMAEMMDKRLDKSTGLEPMQKELGKEVLKVVKSMNPEVKDLDAERLGHFTNLAVKTISHDSSYEHEFNDALVKMHLTAISFAKDQNMYDKLVEKDVDTTSFMMKRIGAAIKMTGRKDFALKAVFEQTACFYQLVDDLEWVNDRTVTYTNPYGRVLEASQEVGIFEDLTLEEVHEKFVIPPVTTAMRKSWV